MSIGERDVGGASTAGTGGSGGAGAGSGGVAERSSTAMEESGRVASSAASSAKDIAAEASAEATNVMAQAKDQISSLMDDTKRELNTQLDARGAQAASGLRTLSGQLQALAEGRTQETGPLGNYVRDAERRVQGFATRLEAEGPQGLLRDATAFARRRPGAFLFGAAVAGFALGRMVRVGAAAAREGESSGSQRAVGVGQPMQPLVGATPRTPSTITPEAESLYSEHGSGVPST